MARLRLVEIGYGDGFRRNRELLIGLIGEFRINRQSSENWNTPGDGFFTGDFILDTPITLPGQTPRRDLFFLQAKFKIPKE